MSYIDELPRLPRGWQWDDDGEAVICPCGDKIELDGTCPEGHESPAMDIF